MVSLVLKQRGGTHSVHHQSYGAQKSPVFIGLIFINDLNIAIKHSESFHFADDACLLNIKDSVKQINKVVNNDLNFLVQWLNANKISLNVGKAEVVIFRGKKKQFDCDPNLKLYGRNLNYQIM